MARAPARRRFAVEVIQTSGMDCGPAALKCLLEGFGLPIAYGRLREACQTDVDGTSIDTLEAGGLGHGAEACGVLAQLLRDTRELDDAALHELIPVGFFSATPAVDPNEVMFQGAVLVRVRGLRADGPGHHPRTWSPPSPTRRGPPSPSSCACCRARRAAAASRASPRSSCSPCSWRRVRQVAGGRRRSCIPSRDRSTARTSVGTMAPMLPGSSAQAPCVIVGGSVAGLTLAAMLARHRKAPTVLFAPPVVESRRLVSGCSLRQSGLHLLAASFGCSPAALIDRITGGRGLFSRMRMCVGRTRQGGSLHLGDAFDIHDTGSATRPLGLSTRHGQILVGLRRELADLGVEIVERSVADREQAAAYAPSQGALLVNATPAPVLGGRLPAATGRFVVAAQAPCVETRGGIRAPLLPGVGHAALLDYADGAHVSFFTPFHDPLSPRASWYGFIGRIVDDADDAPSRIAATTEKLERLAAAFGLALHDPAETLGAAHLPIRREAPLFADGVLDAYYGLDSGAPGVAADGMLAQALGARALAEALVHGHRHPERRVARALTRVRRDNLMAQRMLTKLPVGFVATLARFAPTLIAGQFAPGWLAP